MENACVAQLVGNAVFLTEGAGLVITGTAFMLPCLRMPKSGQLGFQVCSLTSCLKTPKCSVCCTRRGAYAAGCVFVCASLYGGDW